MRACKRDCVAENVVEAEERVLECATTPVGPCEPGGSRTAPPAARSTSCAYAGEVKWTPCASSCVLAPAGYRCGRQPPPPPPRSGPGEASGGRGLLADGRPPEHRRERRRVPQHRGGGVQCVEGCVCAAELGRRRMSGLPRDQPPARRGRHGARAEDGSVSRDSFTQRYPAAWFRASSPQQPAATRAPGASASGADWRPRGGGGGAGEADGRRGLLPGGSRLLRGGRGDAGAAAGRAPAGAELRRRGATGGLRREAEALFGWDASWGLSFL